jgi:hypothetical protein
VSRAALIVASILMLVAPAAVAADATDPPATVPPSAPSPPPAEPPPIVVEPSPATEVQSVTAPPAPVEPPRPAVSAPTPAAAVAATATVLPAPTRLKRERHGLALLGGLGITYAALGGQLRYDIPVGRSLTVSPFVSAGIIAVLPGPIGVTAGLGARHRLIVDLAVVPLERDSLVLHGTTITERTIFGPMAAVGYEHISDSGWIQRCTIEYAYTAWGSVTNRPGHHVIFSGLGFGWRAW